MQVKTNLLVWLVGAGLVLLTSFLFSLTLKTLCSAFLTLLILKCFNVLITKVIHVILRSKKLH